jgi:hypothetical protein
MKSTACPKIPLPRDFARSDKYRFQRRAVLVVEMQPFLRKLKDAYTGIDGVKFFRYLEIKTSAKSW